MSRICVSLITIAVSLFIRYTSSTHAATITVTNKCPHTVWAAASPPGGKELKSGESWKLQQGPNLPSARIWGRTDCSFDSTGKGHCKTGDCNGELQCKVTGKDPQTLAEYTLSEGHDTIDISLVNGFNIPLAFTPTKNIGGDCQAVQCKGDAITTQCPAKLKADGGCNNPCTAIGGVQYCCTSVRGSCSPTQYSMFFKQRCPDAYSYAQDDQTSTKACPSGTDYTITFCP